MNELTCPYCGCIHDTAEVLAMETPAGQSTEFTCASCKKRFMFIVEYVPSFDAWKADCLNGSEHELDTIPGHKEYSIPDVEYCGMCNYRRFLTPEG